MTLVIDCAAGNRDGIAEELEDEIRVGQHKLDTLKETTQKPVRDEAERLGVAKDCNIYVGSSELILHRTK